MPKSALPIGTTPHRRKKAPTKKSAVENDRDYCFGAAEATSAAIPTDKIDGDQTRSKARPKSGGSDDTKGTTDKSSKSSSQTNKENTLNGSKKSHRHNDSVDELNKSMAKVSINSSGSTTIPRQPIQATQHKIRQIPLPTLAFPQINSKSVNISLSESIQRLGDIDTKSLTPALTETIQKSSLKLTSASSLSLEENIPSIKLLIRQCLKSPTYHSLRVSIHCLRSIYGIIDKGTGIKCAFHACVLSGEEMMKSLDAKKDVQVGEYAILTLAAYQVLVRLIRGDKFTCWDGELLLKGKKEILPKRQMVKICLDGGIAASCAFMHLTLLSMRGKGDIKNEFGLDLSGDFQSILTKIAPLLLEIDQEGSKFSKRIFRFLWDGARCVDDIRIGLHLQCLAVAISAQYCVEALPDANTEQKKEIQTLWDRAASSALKAVAVFEKETSPKEMQCLLIEFHNVAGGTLDNVWVQFNLYAEKELGPSSYFEYCVYRSSHLWKFSGSLDCIHSPDELIRENGCKYSSSDAESLSAMACYSIVLLALRSCAALTNEEACSSLHASCDAVISNFDTVARSASQTSQMRCRSMLLLFGLQRDATKMIASCRSECKDRGRELATLGYLLGRCMAPLETRISSSVDDKRKSLSLCLSASDNHAKAASFLDLSVQDTSVSTGIKEKWNTECLRQIRKGFELLAAIVDKADDLESDSTTVLAVEMFAKTTASIAKSLSDRKDMESSTECQLYALELLTRVSTQISSHTSFDKYQISTRYMILASTFQTNGNLEESCAALALAVWSAARRNTCCSTNKHDDANSFVGDAMSEESLLFPGAAMFDVHLDSESIVTGLAVTINKLGRACIETTTSKKACCNTISLPKDTMLATLLETTFNGRKKMSISQLLDRIAWGNGAFPITNGLELIRELLKCISNVLKSCASNGSHSEEDTLAILNELSDFLRLQIDHLRDLVPSEDLQVISSALHVTFAMQLVDCDLSLRSPSARRHHGDANSRGWNNMSTFALKQFQQTDMLFCEASKEGQDGCFFAQWAAVLLQRTIVLEYQETREEQNDYISHSPMHQYNRVLDICSQAIRRLTSTDEEAPVQVIESLILTAKRLLCRFSLNGDPVPSSQCFVILQKLYTLDQHSQHAFDFISDLLWISSKFDDLAAVLFRNYTVDSKHAKGGLLGEEVKQLEQDEQLEAVSKCIMNVMTATSQQFDGQLDSSLFDCTDDSLSDISEFVKDYLRRIESDDADDKMDSDILYTRSEVAVQLQSVVVTTLMLSAKVALNAKRPETAIRYFNACRTECKRMVSLLKWSSRYVQHPQDRLLLIDDLVSMGLERISIAFSSLGIRRKAEDNAILAVMKQKMTPIENPTMSKITFYELIESIQGLDRMYNYLPPLRTLLTIKSLSLSPDKLFMDSSVFKKVDSSTSLDTSLSHSINRSRTFLAFNDSFRYAPDFKDQCDNFLSLANKSINCFVDKEVEGCTEVPLASFVNRTQQEVKLKMKSDTAVLLEKFVNSSNDAPSCLAEAFFELGMESLQKAKSNKELYSIWKDHCISENEADRDEIELGQSSLPHTTQAQKYFNCALLHADPASNYTTKQILRCLALVTGPETLSSFLIHASIGGTSRNIVRDEIDFSGLQEIFNVFDDESSSMESRARKFNAMLSEYSSMIPPSWSTSAVATCPTGDILISSFRATDQGEPITKTLCIFCEQGISESIHGRILNPLDSIIERSQRQLHGIDEDEQNEKYNDEESKRKWWVKRHSIDEDLHALLQTAQDRYFGRELVRQSLVLIPADIPCSDDDSSECSGIGPGNLALRFEAAEREPLPEFDEDAERMAVKKLTVVGLKEKLTSFGIGGSRVQKLRKADLIDLLITEMEKEFQSNQTVAEEHMVIDELAASVFCDTRRTSHVLDEPCSILMLDEHLHRLPFESMDMFANISVTRMPSLPFVFASLYERRSDSTLTPQVDANEVKYIIDPEQNLSETASKMVPALNTLSSENDCEWEGCVGEMPTPEFMTEALTKENGLLLYCGHGGGEKCFSRSQVEDLINFNKDGKSDWRRGCSAAVVLMGCSSGKLKSVNCSKNAADGHVYPIHYEPEGIALSYIYSGAPCVVGNLWDVTDRDIDRYCLTLFKDFFNQPSVNSSSSSLAKCVALARRACKLRYIVGSAPVCYGLPVYIKPND